MKPLPVSARFLVSRLPLALQSKMKHGKSMRKGERWKPQLNLRLIQSVRQLKWRISFFNTPARRKFLRTDKTEFAHIDEVIRRIALAKFNIAFTLTHNGKIVRQYRPATNEEQQLKRVAAICGDDFVQHALRIDWKHDDLHLSGWVATPEFTRSQNDLSYCYINGRMVRDKVITHAIRQAYAEHLHTEQYPAFVLFIDHQST